MLKASVLEIEKEISKTIFTETKSSGKNLISRFFTKSKKPRSIYLWGPVGCGKTHMMNKIFKSCSSSARFIHFQDFLNLISSKINHHSLKQSDTKKAAKTDKMIDNILSKEYLDIEFLFIDEFDPTNIADVILFANALQKLLDKNTTILINSNHIYNLTHMSSHFQVRCKRLISLFKKYFDKFEIISDFDHRMSMFEKSGNSRKIFHAYDKNYSLEKIAQNFCNFESFTHEKIKLGAVSFDFKRVNLQQKILYSNFEELFERKLSATNFSKLSQYFKIIFVERIRKINDDELSCATRLINFIDHAYFNRVELYASVGPALSDIYNGAALKTKFSRALSRLYEMSSDHYPRKINNK